MLQQRNCVNTCSKEIEENKTGKMRRVFDFNNCICDQTESCTIRAVSGTSVSGCKC